MERFYLDHPLCSFALNVYACLHECFFAGVSPHSMKMVLEGLKKNLQKKENEIIRGDGGEKADFLSPYWLRNCETLD